MKLGHQSRTRTGDRPRCFLETLGVANDELALGVVFAITDDEVEPNVAKRAL